MITNVEVKVEASNEERKNKNVVKKKNRKKREANILVMVQMQLNAYVIDNPLQASQKNPRLYLAFPIIRTVNEKTFQDQWTDQLDPNYFALYCKKIKSRQNVHQLPAMGT